jgi:hypothetical protein
MKSAIKRKIIEDLVVANTNVRNYIINESSSFITSIKNILMVLILTKNFRIEIYNHLLMITSTLKLTLTSNNEIESKLNELLQEYNQLNSTQDHSHKLRLMSKKVGAYLPGERTMKIMNFKINKFIRSLKKPVCRKYEGRSVVAKNKIRLRGKFIKKINSRKIFSVIKC